MGAIYFYVFSDVTPKSHNFIMF